jgi:hypothetical protein
MAMTSKHRLRFFSLWRREDGVAYIEFALLVPIFLGALYASIELTRYIHINQKLEKATFQVADIVAQSSVMQTSTLNEISNAMSYLMSPYPMGGSTSRMIISSVARPDGDVPRVRWQYCSGSLASASGFGTVGQPAVFPPTFDIANKEDIIVAEFFYNYQPLLNQSVISPTTLYKFAVYRPRLGALDGFVSSCAGG